MAEQDGQTPQGEQGERKSKKGVFAVIGGGIAAAAFAAAKIAEVVNNSTGAMLNINELQKQSAETEQTTVQTAEPERTTAQPEIVTEVLTTAPDMTTAAVLTETEALSSVITTVQETLSSAALTISETTVISSGTAAAEPPKADDSVHADSVFRLKTIGSTGWKMSSISDVPQFFDYDEKTGTLYYMPDKAHIMAYSAADGASKTVVDFSDKADSGNYVLGGLAVNPFNGKLYAVIMLNRKPVLYNISDDREAVPDLGAWNYGRAAYRLVFSDAETVLVIDQREHEHVSYSLNGKLLDRFEWMASEGRPKELGEMNFRMPFLYHDCWYYAEKTEFYAGSGTSLLAAKTVRLDRKECGKIDKVMQGDEDSICGISVGRDALCYFNKQNKNICLYNPDGERKEGTLLADASNEDILLVDGSKIEETASGSLSAKVPVFLRIDNSRFVMYDASDSTLKLLYTE